jgi:hypothetical protein
MNINNKLSDLYKFDYEDDEMYNERKDYIIAKFQHLNNSIILYHSINKNKEFKIIVKQLYKDNKITETEKKQMIKDCNVFCMKQFIFIMFYPVFFLNYFIKTFLKAFKKAWRAGDYESY